MPNNNYTTPMTSEECLNYIRPSTERQFITPGADVVTVTLKNPQSIKNNDNAPKMIAYRLRGESVMGTAEYFEAGQSVPGDVVEIGNTGAHGTTATSVIVKGVR
jgi:hypothetical protein